MSGNGNGKMREGFAYVDSAVAAQAREALASYDGVVVKGVHPSCNDLAEISYSSRLTIDAIKSVLDGAVGRDHRYVVGWVE